MIRADRLYDGLGEDVLTDAAIVFADGALIEVGPSAVVSASYAGAEVQRYDYGDATILPGMIDAHCHVTLSGVGLTYAQEIEHSDELMALIAVDNLQRHLRSGVTTIRDLGGRNRVPFEVREGLRRGYFIGPTMLVAGRPVTHTLGHLHWCNGVADGDVALRRAVRALIAEGADYIKVMASGGATSGNKPYHASYSRDELRVVAETAHDLGTRTAAHCRASVSMMNAIEAGIDCIEHAEFLVRSPMLEVGHGVAASGRMVYDPRITEAMHRAGTSLSFTLQTGGYHALRRLQQTRLERALTPEETARASSLQEHFEEKLGIFASLVADGMKPRMAISTDAGPYDVGFGALQHGLQLAVDAGLSPRDAIDAVTRIPAEICDIDSEVGTLRTGRRADVLVVDGDPLADIAHMSRVRAVFHNGTLVESAEPQPGAHA